MVSPFPRSFYNGNVCDVAQRLLGQVFIRILPDGSRLSGRIVEVEAYAQDGDPASHSYRGRTERNAVMFGEAGRLYVYFTYGMHFCCNVVTGPEGQGDAVLIRALEPLEGRDIMAFHRYGRTHITAREEMNLLNGPAKLCKAFGIDRKMNGYDLCGETVRIVSGNDPRPPHVGRSSRIGIGSGSELAWRFFIPESDRLSKPGKGILPNES